MDTTTPKPTPWSTYLQVKRERRYATLTEAAFILGRSPSTLRHQIAKRKLTAHKVGRDWLVSLSALDRYGTDHWRETKADSDRVAAAMERRAAYILGLSEDQT